MVLFKYTLLIALTLHLMVDPSDNKIVTNEVCVLRGCRGLVLPFTSPKLPPKSLTISCNITQPSNDKIDKWYKDGIFLSEDKYPNYKITQDNENSSLVIRESTASDVGDYKCESNKGDSATIKVRLRPHLEPFHEYFKNNYKSANIVEGDKFYLECTVKSDFATDVNITWFRYDDSQIDDDSYIDLNDSKLIPIVSDERLKIDGNNTIRTLTIDKVQPSDRSYYICIANNGVAFFNNTILLRVKDRLGALWPFLGIVAEVIILCTIIFIYEKRRIKPDFDESDDDHNTEAKSTPQDRSEKADVRQRK